MKRLGLAVLALSLATTGCQGVFGVRLPGGAAKGPTYSVTVMFADVLDLVPQASVKVDDVAVGDVDSITLDRQTYQAKVRVRLRKSVHLPANAHARLRQTSLLGEKFVELSPPVGEAPQGELRDGDVIEAENTGRTPEIEEVFTALSALLNGGGIGNLQTIAAELSAALAGREEQVRGAFHHITHLIQALDARKTEIVRAVDALDRLTTTLVKQKQTIAQALDTFAPALTVLANERADLTRLLTHLSALGKVGTRVVRLSYHDTVADFRLLAPILDQVVKARGDLGKTLNQLKLLTTLVPRAIPGDYLQLYMTVFVDPANPPAPGGATPLRSLLASVGSPPAGASGLLPLVGRAVL